MALVSMTLLFLFQAILADLFNQNYSSEQVILYHLMSVPQIFVQMAPPAVLLAAVLTLSGLSRTHELIACYAIGFGLRRIMTILLFIVVTLSFSILVHSRPDFAAPFSDSHYLLLERDAKTFRLFSRYQTGQNLVPLKQYDL